MAATAPEITGEIGRRSAAAHTADDTTVATDPPPGPTLAEAQAWLARTDTPAPDFLRRWQLVAAPYGPVCDALHDTWHLCDRKQR